VDKGSDFPAPIQSHINSWQTSCLLRSNSSRLTTRGWNSYDSSENRVFNYATPKLRLDQNALSSPLLKSKSYHIISSPTRCIELVKSILSLRKQIKTPSALPRPLFIWEPVPDLCIPDQLLETTRALSHVDICSPNHAELGSLMGCSGILPDGSVDRTFIEDATEQLLGSMPISSFSIVVRAGKDGCYIGKNGGGIKKRTIRPAKAKSTKQKRRPIHGRGGLSSETDFADLFARLESANRLDEDSEESEKEDHEPDWGIWAWIPAYHSDSSSVVDPTGAGNAFLGGLAVALARRKGLEEAARWGSVSASFAIEQVGMPVLGQDAEGREVWNGVRVEERLGEFERRLAGKGGKI
jgi:sugar/nucleoside kinase (ribokinase family)